MAYPVDTTGDTHDFIYRRSSILPVSPLPRGTSVYSIHRHSSIVDHSNSGLHVRKKVSPAAFIRWLAGATFIPIFIHIILPSALVRGIACKLNHRQEVLYNLILGY